MTAVTLQQAFEIALDHHQQGRLAEAESLYRQILNQQPNFADVLHLLGALAGQVGRFDDAIELIGRAIQLNPTAAMYCGNLGELFFRMNRFDDAIAAFNAAAELEKETAEGHYYRATAFKLGSRFEEAAAEFARSIELNPGKPETHWHYSRVLLTLGNYSDGWEEYEWRLNVPDMGLNRGFSQPRWDGAAARDKAILVHAEGGYGDTLQFIRFIPLIAGRVGRLILECQGSLASLLGQVKGIDGIIPRGQALPAFDMQTSLLSLPRILRITMENLPNFVPYLTAAADRVASWAARVAENGRLKVGLVWAGSDATFDGRTRSLAAFAPLAKVTRVKFFSLQKGPESSQERPAGMELTDFTAELHDFADTAALIENLDLVISVDTSVAHLAGAMGKPVWVLIPLQHAVGDFRWLANRNDTPWYPTMRLFRQTNARDWIEPMEKIVAALESF